MNNLIPIEPEYVYITIPAEYICVYHRIMAMLADYGEDMLKDCKATCTDRNSGVIECFNMFNAAVAARKLGKYKLAETLIKYIKAKINQIYKGKDNSTSFIFPIDENGQIKAFVSCGDTLKFEIDPDDGNLYYHKVGDGKEEHFKFPIKDHEEEPIDDNKLQIILTPRYELYEGEYVPCCDLVITYNGNAVDRNKAIISYYFDDINVTDFKDVVNLSEGIHSFMVVVTYKGETEIAKEFLSYNITN